MHSGSICGFNNFDLVHRQAVWPIDGNVAAWRRYMVGSGLFRSSSVNYPEAYAPAKDEKPRYECFGGQQHDVRAHYGDASKAGGDADKEVGGPSSQKRICGIRRKLFFWILAIVILVIVIAAVLGGVLGSVLGNASSEA